MAFTTYFGIGHHLQVDIAMQKMHGRMMSDAHRHKQMSSMKAMHLYIYNIEVNSLHGVTTGIEAALFADPF